MCPYQRFTLAVLVVVTVFSQIRAVPVLKLMHCPIISTNSTRGAGGDIGFLDSSSSTSPKLINMDSVEGHKVRLQFAFPNGGSRKRGLGSGGSVAPSTEAPRFDVFCQWDFTTSNHNQFLLLTFEKLSAPFSDNCADAYIAMQKSNGYESRWCGNRKQTGAKAVSLFSKGRTKVAVFRSATAAVKPNTSFTLIAELVDVSQIESGKNHLRVLLG